LKAKNTGRRISSLNWKGTTILIVLIITALVATHFWASEKASENAEENKQQEAENEHERTAQRNRCQAEQKRWSMVSASQIEICDTLLIGIGNNGYNISAVVNNKSEPKVIGCA